MSSQAQLDVLGDRYEILAPIGSGSAANVFRVRDRRSGAIRAAKILKPENAADPGILARFEDEFRILRTLHHPHLPEVYDYGWTDDGGRFLIMELVDGAPLDEHFRSNPGDIWVILYELCETLTFVHNHKLLHQDIKPSNILVRRTTAFGPDLPLVKLIDFGLTYRRDTGAVVELVGTPEYMSPEVVRGESPLTRAVDYYSLGVTLYELLCGRPPFVGPESQVMRAHLQREPVIQEEQLEWAELYPHVRALLTKDWRKRLEAFEELRRAVTSRLTGGIEALDRAYGLARKDSLPMVGMEEVGTWLAQVDDVFHAGTKRVPMLEVRGRSGTLRSRLVDFVAADCAIRGCYVTRFGAEFSADLLQSESSHSRQVDRFDRAIARLENLHPTAILLVVDGIEHVSDEEASFIRYLSTKRALAPNSATPVVFVTARGWGTDSHPLDPYLPQYRQSIQMPADTTTSTVHDDDEDIRAQALASAVFEGGQRSDVRRKLLAYVVSHPVAVPSEWARGFTESTAAEFASDLDQLVTRHLVYKVVVDGADALVASTDARAVARNVVSSEVMCQSHRALIARLTHTITSQEQERSSMHELVAYHHAAIGDDRLAVVSRIRAVKSAWREGSLSNIESLSQSSLEALADSDNTHNKAARRYFAKQWVNALWARNQHTRAKRVIDDHLLNHGDAIPPGLLAKYIRGILDAEEPASALSFLDAIDVGSLSVIVKEQILLERALILWHCARHHESLAVLDGLRDSTNLSVRDRYRLTIYHAMNMGKVASHDAIEGLLGEAAAGARADGCNDEYVLISAILAQGQITKGCPRDALRAIARILPVARRHALELRTNLLYRLSASAYQDMGLPRKAIQSQRKAITLASALGLPQFEAMSWMRLSEYERVLGNFGNTIRFLEKARPMMATSSYEADRARFNLMEVQIHSWLRSPDCPDVVGNAAWIAGIKDVTEQGRYFTMLGRYWSEHGDWDRAWRCYNKATELLRQTGFVDHLIILARARLQLALATGIAERVLQERDAINSPALRMVDTTSGRLERNLGLLEYAFRNRVKWSSVSRLCETCLQLCDETTEATSRLEALSLVFRAYARTNKHVEAEAAFRQFFLLLKSATSNLDDRYVAGLLDRLDLAQLTREFDLMEKRNKAGVATSLVA